MKTMERIASVGLMCCHCYNFLRTTKIASEKKSSEKKSRT